MRDELTIDELRALAALLQAITRGDERAMREQHDRSLALASQLSLLHEKVDPSGSPYRGAARADPLTPGQWVEIHEWASTHLRGDSLRAALSGVSRREAREIIYATAHDIAATGAMTESEMAMLRWVEEAWELFE